MAKLLAWKKQAKRLPLILWGARQVGKTWLLREFGRQYYAQTVYVNFEEDAEVGDYFQKTLNPHKLIASLSRFYHCAIDPQNTLIIFDEIQECPRAKNSLKYFAEDAPEYHIVAAGSFLGVATGKAPVGKVNNLTLYPLTFYEFLEALGRADILETILARDVEVLNNLDPELRKLLWTYFYVGGMPFAVDTYIAAKGDLAAVRQAQKDIIKICNGDFSHHIYPYDISKVRMLWASIPLHLGREKKKFIYKDIKEGARAADYKDALRWLLDTGLVYRVSRISTPALPLVRNPEREVFKIFLFDIGILGAMFKFEIDTFEVSNPKMVGDLKGAMTEQFVCQELQAIYQDHLFYWGRDKAAAELDFLLQDRNLVVPIEAKANLNTKAKSMAYYLKAYQPSLAIKTSLCQYRFDPPVLSLPLYMIGSAHEIIASLKLTN